MVSSVTMFLARGSWIPLFLSASLRNFIHIRRFSRNGTVNSVDSVSEYPTAVERLRGQSVLTRGGARDLLGSGQRKQKQYYP